MLPVFTELVEDGDMVLCRTNAPLVSVCFRFLKMGKKCNIQGKDVGQGLISLIVRLGRDGTIPELVAKIDDWRKKETDKELAKRHPSEEKLDAIDDKTSCLQCFTEGATMIQDVIRKIESVFTDDKSKPGILLSSIHKSKGLEATNVFLLQPPVKFKRPNSQGWQAGQERNLEYVARTRAIMTLTYVS